MSISASDLLTIINLIVTSARPAPFAGMNTECSYYLIPAGVLDRAREVIAAKAQEGGAS